MNVLEAKGLTKIFPGVVALDNVDISFEEAQIHCVVGENGAGKSTLIKCLTGVYSADEGEIIIQGKNAAADRDRFSHVVFVPQEIDLFPHLSVAENLFIPFDKTGISGLISQRELERRALPIIESYGIHAAPDTPVRDISVADQQLLQIARATMRKDYEAIILDEPTSSLTDEDVNRVFSVVRREKESGKAVIYISHKLNEIFAIGDVVSVFRNGKKIESARVSDVDESWIVQKMIGKYLRGDQTFFSEKVSDQELLRVDHLYGTGFRDVSFTLKEGEILGFAGLIGAGRTEVMQAIYGLNHVYAGDVYFHGRKLNFNDPAGCVEQGIVYLPEDRKRNGLLPVMSVKNNVSALSLSHLVRHGVVNKKAEDKATYEIAGQYGLNMAMLDRQIKNLSGGNQQKAIVARSMMAEPKVIILDEPTKGIDVGTKYEIYRLMNNLAEQGYGVIFISSELDEILRCCNRIIVMYEGEIMCEFPQEPDKARVMSALIGSDKNRNSEGGIGENGQG